jgi:hypothetical protein
LLVLLRFLEEDFVEVVLLRGPDHGRIHGGLPEVEEFVHFDPRQQQGRQIFLDTKYQNADNVLKVRKMYQIAIR